MKTIKLNRAKFAQLPPTVERTVRDGAYGAAMIVMLMLVHTLLRPTPVVPQALPKPERPIIVIATARPLPTWTPAPTQTPAPTPEPQVVYVEAPTVVIYIAVEQPAEPTPAPEATQAPQTAAIQDRAQWSVAAATARAQR